MGPTMDTDERCQGLVIGLGHSVIFGETAGFSFLLSYSLAGRKLLDGHGDV